MKRRGSLTVPNGTIDHKVISDPFRAKNETWLPIKDHEGLICRILWFEDTADEVLSS